MKVKVEDDCQTAADVMARSRAVRDRLRRQRAMPEPVKPVPVPKFIMPASFAPSGGSMSVKFPVAAQPYSVNVSFGPSQATVKIRVEDVIETVCEITGISRVDIKSRRRTRYVVEPRHLAMALARRMTLRSLPEIGRMFDGRDHTTVLHAVQKYKELLDAIGARIGEGASLTMWATEAWELIRTRRVPRAGGPITEQAAA